MVTITKSTLDIFNHLHNLVAICHGETILNLNTVGVEMLGMASEGQAMGRNFFDFLHPDYQDFADMGMEMFANDETVISVKFLRSDLTEIEADLWVSRIGNLEQNYFMVEAHDMTKHLRAARGLRSREQRLEGIINTVADGILSLDDMGVIQAINPAAQIILGMSRQVAIGRNIRDMIDLKSDEASSASGYMDDLDTEWAQRLSTSLELRATRLDGTKITIEIAVRELQSGQRISYTCIFRDVSARVKERERMYQLAHHDILTGLPNRNLLMDRMEEAGKRAVRNNTKAAILFIDLNKFKPINDLYGHETGDLVLREISYRLSTSIRNTDTAARVGGDEFVVVLEGLHDRSEAETIVGKILERMSEPVYIGEDVREVGASIGIGMYPEDHDDIDQLLNVADRAMYACKQKYSTDSNFVFYQDQPNVITEPG